MLASLVPMFDKDMAVAAYCLFAQKENLFTNPHLLGSGRYDGAGCIVGIDVLNNIDVDTLSKQSYIVVPVNNISLFADIKEQYHGPRDRLVLLLDPSVKPEDSYISRLKILKEQGFKLAIKRLDLNQAEEYQRMMDLFDIVTINCNSEDIENQATYYKKLVPNIILAAENVNSMEQFEELKETGYFTVYEGDFYRIPITKNSTEVSPLKANYLKLLNIINQPDYELTEVANVISKDPALTISLLNVVNKLTVNSNISSIKQATAILGQIELKRWLNTSVLSSLCADKPNEITRLSLIRAKFAENLAAEFEMGMKTEELFLMGLFSVLDIILDMPMEAALDSVSVSGDIKNALVNQKGDLAKVFVFEIIYEAADWQEVSRQMLLHNMDMENIYMAYVDALKWYKEMFM